MSCWSSLDFSADTLTTPARKPSARVGPRSMASNKTATAELFAFFLERQRRRFTMPKIRPRGNARDSLGADQRFPRVRMSGGDLQASSRPLSYRPARIGPRLRYQLDRSSFTSFLFSQPSALVGTLPVCLLFFPFSGMDSGLTPIRPGLPGLPGPRSPRVLLGLRKSPAGEMP